VCERERVCAGVRVCSGRVTARGGKRECETDNARHQRMRDTKGRERERVRVVCDTQNA